METKNQKFFKKFFSIHFPLYLMAFTIAILAKWFCRLSDSDAYLWILTPTSWWVSALSGISFEYVPHTGYINHFHRFLIAPACCGIRFMLITFLMLIFSFLHPGSALAKKENAAKSYLWFAFSILFSYLAAVFVNGIRISVSIYLPIVLEEAGVLSKNPMENSGGWLTQDNLHTIIGTVIYFSSLCILYPAAAFIYQHGFLRTEKKEPSAPVLLSSCIPAFWYLLTILVIPVLGRIYRREWNGFGQYASLVLVICLIVTTASFLFRRLHTRKSHRDYLRKKASHSSAL